jgi:WD40 repeat protein
MKPPRDVAEPPGSPGWGTLFAAHGDCDGWYPMATIRSGREAGGARARRGRRRSAKASATPASTYKAFISYSHAVDGRLAPALQSGLQRFAKRWSQLRAMRVFRDQASLSANPALWPSIESALRESEYFILLASPAAAASPWVDREVSWWVTEKDPATLLIALTDGALCWDFGQRRLDSERTTALPPALRNTIREEPRHVDLRWAAAEDDVSMRDPRFRGCVADLAATLHGRPKDELFGEDVRQHRRTTRLARAAVAIMALLAVAATVAAVVAASQQRRAIAQARLATARQLAVTASSSVDTEYDLALLLAVQALRIENTAAARASLFSALERTPQHVTFLRASLATVADVQVSPDGAVVVGGDAEGNVVVWSVPDGAVLRRLRVPGSAPVQDVAISADGTHLAVGSGNGDVMVWNLSSGEGRPVQHHETAVGAVAFSPDGTQVASGDSEGFVLVTEIASEALVVRLQHHSPYTQRSVDRVSFSPDGLQLSAGSDGAVTRWELDDGREVFSGGGLGAHTAFDEYSDDLLLQADAVGGGGHGVYVSPLDGDAGSTSVSIPGQAEALAFSPDNELLAVAGQGAVRLFGTQSLEPDPGTPIVAGYPAAVASISFSTDRRWMAVASGDAVVLSDLSSGHHVGRVVSEPQDTCNGCLDDRAVAIGPDDRTVAWLDSGSDGPGRVRLWDLTDRTPAGTFEVDVTDVGAVAFAPDGSSVLTGNPAAEWALDGTRRSPPSPLTESAGVVTSTSFTAEGRGLAVTTRIQDDGWTLLVHDVTNGRLILNTPPTENLPATALTEHTLAVGLDDGSIALWDLESRRRVALLQSDRAVTGQTRRSGHQIDSLSFDGAGEQLASVSGGTITVWDVQRRNASTTLRWGGQGQVRFSPNGRLLAAGSQDGAITLWDVSSREELGTLIGQNPRGSPPDMTFSGDGSTMASAIGGGGLMLWDLNVESWIRTACSITNRDLTNAEWERHVGDVLPRTSTCASQSLN